MRVRTLARVRVHVCGCLYMRAFAFEILNLVKLVPV